MKRIGTFLLLLGAAFAAQAQDTVRVNRSTTIDSSSIQVRPTAPPAQEPTRETLPAERPQTVTPAPAPAPAPAPRTMNDDPMFNKRVYIGARYMPTFQEVSTGKTANGVATTSWIVGQGGGGLVGVNFNRNWGMQLEGIYTAISQRYKSPDVAEREVRLQYLNIPLMMMFNTGYDKAVNFNVGAGPQYGILVGSDVKTIDNGDGTSVVQGKLAVKSGDIGLAYGLGVDFGLDEERKFKINLGYRGVIGLFDVSSNSQSGTSSDAIYLDRSHAKSYSFYTGISYAF